MRVGVSDKRIKLLLRTPPGEPVKGLQPAVVASIRFRHSVLSAADSLKEVADAHPEWRVHRWQGSKTRWSIDVTGSTRFTFQLRHQGEGDQRNDLRRSALARAAGP